MCEIKEKFKMESYLLWRFKKENYLSAQNIPSFFSCAGSPVVIES